MRVGFLQMAPAFVNPGESIKRIEAALKDAPMADLYVLPELCNSGYSFLSREQAESSAESTDGPFVTFLIDQCRMKNCFIVSGLNEREGDDLYNSAVLVGQAGIVGKYRKLHLYNNEPDFFEPGNFGLPVFEISGVRIGMLVCFDWRFPEVWRIMALQGADIVCLPSNIVDVNRTLRALPGHALCNHIFVVMCNRTGTEGELTFGGRSTSFGPTGEVLIQASTDKTEAGVVDIDVNLARDKTASPRNHSLNDRRPAEYRLIVSDSREKGIR